MERVLDNSLHYIIDVQSCYDFRRTLKSVMKFMVIVSRSTFMGNQVWMSLGD